MRLCYSSFIMDVEAQRMAKMTSPPGNPVASNGVARIVLPVTAVVPDGGNRPIVEDDEFQALCDSIRLMGVLDPVQVWRRPDGTHRLIDGERRWRAAQQV